MDFKGIIIDRLRFGLAPKKMRKMEPQPLLFDV